MFFLIYNTFPLMRAGVGAGGPFSQCQKKTDVFEFKKKIGSSVNMNLKFDPSSAVDSFEIIIFSAKKTLFEFRTSNWDFIQCMTQLGSI